MDTIFLFVHEYVQLLFRSPRKQVQTQYIQDMDFFPRMLSLPICVKTQVII